MAYEVQQHTICEGWISWLSPNESGELVPQTFATYAEAEQEIKDHITDCIEEVEAGNMEDSPDPSEFRIVEI